MSDPIADMINRIKNAQAVFKETVKIPYSDLKNEIAQILEKEKWVIGVEKKGKIPLKFIEIGLKYEEKIPAISKVKRISMPGKRIYSSFNEIKKVRDGRGMSIISTSKGLMIDREARKQKQGGEVLFEIW